MNTGRTPSKCLICGGRMETGFVIDTVNHAQRRQQAWGAGEPQRSFWFRRGIKMPDHVHTVTTHRCEACGYLMEFANPEEAA